MQCSLIGSNTAILPLRARAVQPPTPAPCPWTQPAMSGAWSHRHSSEVSALAPLRTPLPSATATRARPSAAAAHDRPSVAARLHACSLTCCPSPLHPHARQDRPSKPESPTKREAGRLSRMSLDERKQGIGEREAERLAERIVQVWVRGVGCDARAGRCWAQASCTRRARQGQGCPPASLAARPLRPACMLPAACH